MEPVYLRPLEPGDLERTYQWHNSPELYQTLVGSFRYAGRVAETEWLESKMSFSRDEVNLAVCETETGEHIGNIYLTQIDWISRNANVGILIGIRENRGKGYGPAATRLMVRHAFQDLGLRRVYAYTLAENGPGIRSLEKSGFVVEGRLRNHVFKCGEFRDLLVLGRCTDDPIPEMS